MKKSEIKKTLKAACQRIYSALKYNGFQPDTEPAEEEGQDFPNFLFEFHYSNGSSLTVEVGYLEWKALPWTLTVNDGYISKTIFHQESSSHLFYKDEMTTSEVSKAILSRMVLSEEKG